MISATRALLLVVVLAANFAAAATPDRQQEVRDRGAGVMPFSLDASVHSFDATVDGGIQRVRSQSPDQAAKIRAHLAQITEAFDARRFDQPAHIHGAGMPGLAEMRTAEAGELTATYRELLDGGEIVYVARSPRIVEAVHRWFDAQLADHGSDAVRSSVPTTLEPLAWLAGAWLLEAPHRRIEETWSAPGNDLMIGMSRTVADGRTRSFEFLRIALRDDGIVYVAQPGGRPPVEFPLRIWDGNEAVFVNPGHADHLRRIIYRRNPDGSMTARVEGEDGGRAFAQEFAYRHVDASTAAR
jgi:hypothetical protein